MNIIYKNSSSYVETLSIIIKDIERILILFSYLNINEKNLLDKLETLKKSLDYEKEKSSPSGVYITLSYDYLAIDFVDYQNIIEINSKTDMMAGVENKILIKRNMREFYFYSRGIIHQVDEGTCITQKINNNWNKEHFTIIDNLLSYDHPELDFDELVSEKVHKKGSI